MANRKARGEPAAIAGADAGEDAPFWKRKTLREMTSAEWESLCDGCGRCCLVKLEEDVGDDPTPEAEANAKIYYTDVGCRLLDGETCRCKDYENRFTAVPDCLRIDAQAVEEVGWLPPTCAYRLVDEGKDLPWWHPLISGDPMTVVWAGVSVRGRVTAPEDDVLITDLEKHIVNWPMRWPKAARNPPQTPVGKNDAPPPVRSRTRKRAV